MSSCGFKRLPFKASYMVRPGVIQPRHGIRSKTRLYRVGYAALSPLVPLLKLAFPGKITDTDKISRAMIKVARSGAPKTVLENDDLNALGA